LISRISTPPSFEGWVFIISNSITMKLIHLNHDWSFLSFPKMAMTLEGGQILFVELGQSEPIGSFKCWTEDIAKECYNHLCECLSGPDCHVCDLVNRHAMLKECWDLAPTLAPAMLALQDANKEDLSFSELRPLRDALFAIDATGKYASSCGMPSSHGKFVLKFYESQREAANA
jgi:hypothetical protein